MEYSQFIEEREKFVPFISNYLESHLDSEKVGNIKWEMAFSMPLDERISNRYNDLSLKDFLALYKIDRLEKINIISDIIAQDLRDLLSLKIELGYKVGEYALSDSKEENAKVKKLLEEITKIENIFARYHLLENFNLKKVIDNAINNEDYGHLKENMNMQNQIYDEISNMDDKESDRTIRYLNALLDRNNNIQELETKKK